MKKMYLYITPVFAELIRIGYSLQLLRKCRFNDCSDPALLDVGVCALDHLKVHLRPSMSGSWKNNARGRGSGRNGGGNSGGNFGNGTWDTAPYHRNNFSQQVVGGNSNVNSIVNAVAKVIAK